MCILGESVKYLGGQIYGLKQTSGNCWTCCLCQRAQTQGPPPPTLYRMYPWLWQLASHQPSLPEGRTERWEKRKKPKEGWSWMRSDGPNVKGVTGRVNVKEEVLKTKAKHSLINWWKHSACEGIYWNGYYLRKWWREMTPPLSGENNQLPELPHHPLKKSGYM